MSNAHEHKNNPPPAGGPPALQMPEEAGSQALAEALHSSFAIVKFAMWGLVAVFVATCFFTVGPQEKAVILRFGKPVGEGEKALLGAGLHWSFPYPIDERIRIPITEIQNVTTTVGWIAMTREQELAWQTTGALPPATGPSLNPAVDGYLITADQNVIHSRATLYYRVEDPVRCVFGFSGGTNAGYDLSGISNAVLNALNNALVSTAARFTVDDILYRNVAGFKDEVRRTVARLVEQNRLGVTVDHCEVYSIPPRQLKAAFDKVTTARENRTRLLNEARRYENQVLSQADAKASALTNQAAAEKARLVESLTAEAKRFNDLLPKYRSNPALFTQVQLVESLGRALTNVQDKIFLPERADGKTRELRLLLNREPQRPKLATPTQP